MKSRTAIAARAFEEGLAKRELVRVENTRGDRERIANLETGMAELSRRIDQLKENSAIPLIPKDDGGLLAAVRELEDNLIRLQKQQQLAARIISANSNDITSHAMIIKALAGGE